MSLGPALPLERSVTSHSHDVTMRCHGPYFIIVNKGPAPWGTGRLRRRVRGAPGVVFSWEGSWFRSLRSCENTRTYSSLCARGLWMSLRLGTRAMRSVLLHWTSSLAIESSLPETSFLPPSHLSQGFYSFTQSALSTYYVLCAAVNGKCRGQCHLLQTSAGHHPPAKGCMMSWGLRSQMEAGRLRMSAFSA